jgi:Flp pilus assembly protein CpaB
VPDGALASASALVGRLLSAGMRRGEPFTDVRLVGAGLLPPGDDRVVAPVRLADAAAVSVLRAGDRISVIAVLGSSAASGRATQVVGHALVLAVPAAGGTPDGAGSGSGLGAPSASTDPLDGALVLLALSTPEATSLAAAARAGSLSFVLDPAPAPSFGGPSP